MNSSTQDLYRYILVLTHNKCTFAVPVFGSPDFQVETYEPSVCGHSIPCKFIYFKITAERSCCIYANQPERVFAELESK